jgi:hypothetical protein
LHLRPLAGDLGIALALAQRQFAKLGLDGGNLALVRGTRTSERLQLRLQPQNLLRPRLHLRRRDELLALQILKSRQRLLRECEPLAVQVRLGCELRGRSR